MKKNSPVKYYFDKDADVLYFTKKEPSARDISMEIGDGIIVRVTPGTNHVVGFTILNFLKRQTETSIPLPFTAEFEMI